MNGTCSTHEWKLTTMTCMYVHVCVHTCMYMLNMVSDTFSRTNQGTADMDNSMGQRVVYVLCDLSVC